MSFENQVYLDLSKNVYSEHSDIDVAGCEPIVIEGVTDDKGFYVLGNFTARAYQKDGEIILSFRGTDTTSDLLVSDLAILNNEIPTVSLAYARSFYATVKDLYPDATFSFTGHSLGGAIAQLMGAQHPGSKTVTFNAPGMLTNLTQIGLDPNAEYTNITNYSILNDHTGNYKAHVGETYYIAPVPIENSPLLDTHNSILEYNEEDFGPIFSKPEDFGTREALALWAFDYKNYSWVSDSAINLQKITKHDLFRALSILQDLYKNGDFPQKTFIFKTKEELIVLKPDGNIYAADIFDGMNNIYDLYTQALATEPYRRDPLLIDLDGGGIQTTNLENGIYFDHDNNGFAESSAWVGSGDGIFVFDKNANGTIDNGNEIFADNYVNMLAA